MQVILIIQTAFLGDVILATGMIEKLRKHFPQAKIDFMLRKGSEALLQNNPHLNKILIWNKKQKKYRHLFKMIQIVRQRKYDTVINLQRFFSTGLITILSGARHTVGFNKNPLAFLFKKSVKHVTKPGLHEIDRNFSLISAYTDTTRMLPKLYPSAKDFEKVKPWQQQPYVCIAPGSVWFTKRFPIQKWVELIQELHNQLAIYILGGAEDSYIAEQIIGNGSNHNFINLTGKLSFLASAALMKNAHMNYVNDSAPLHLASAMNAPVTAIFCATVLAFGFGPLSDQAAIWETPEKLPCRPCSLHGRTTCPLGTFACAYTIPIK